LLLNFLVVFKIDIETTLEWIYRHKSILPNQ
jgi:hypothetical protein